MTTVRQTVTTVQQSSGHGGAPGLDNSLAVGYGGSTEKTAVAAGTRAGTRDGWWRCVGAGVGRSLLAVAVALTCQDTGLSPALTPRGRHSHQRQDRPATTIAATVVIAVTTACASTVTEHVPARSMNLPSVDDGQLKPQISRGCVSQRHSGRSGEGSGADDSKLRCAGPGGGGGGGGGGGEGEGGGDGDGGGDGGGNGGPVVAVAVSFAVPVAVAKALL
ncbi:Protein of unknown function [Gryllus bimaculatus]|nr:Protein of unknown function [Gryllus bimaculatus]